MSSKRKKYRLAMLDDHTLREVFHIRVNLFGAVSTIIFVFLLLLGLLSLLIVYTPIRNILPGYDANVRQQLLDESERVDSLQSSLALQSQYVDVIRQVVAGDLSTDSVQTLDSLQVIAKMQIEELESEELDAFMAQYEQKERDRLQLFDNTLNRTMHQFYRPVRGVVLQEAEPDLNRYGTVIRTSGNENVLAVSRGKVIAVERVLDNTYEVVIQNGTFLAVYRHMPKVFKTAGVTVDKGEIIGMTDGQHDLEIELWDAGEFVNAAEVIVW